MLDRVPTEQFSARHPLFEKASFTIGDLYTAVLAIDNEDDARAFYRDYVAYEREHGKDPYKSNPEPLVKANIGWIYGEGMAPERIEMWVRTTGAAHPVFGTVMPSAEDAFAAGKRMGEAKP